MRPIQRVQQPSYPMVKLTQAEIAAMIGRREERRKLALEEIERRNNIKNKKNKKRRSKSKDTHGLPKIEGKKAVRKLMNSFLGKTDKSILFGVKDEKDEIRTRGTREPRDRTMSAPGSHISGARSVIDVSEMRSRYDTITIHTIGHPNSDMSYSNGHRPRSQYGPGHNYRRFQDSSYSSFSETNSMTRRSSIDTISIYLSGEMAVSTQAVQGHRK